ncbi:hypothetical protein L3Q82_008401, partial [Scortum barcoo]
FTPTTPPLSQPSVHTYPQFTPTRHLPLHTLSCATSPPSTPPCSSLLLTTHQVRNALKKKNRARKAAGPDGISSRLLKSCADQLCGIFGAKDTAPQGAQQLQAGSSDVSSDEDAGETGPRPSAPAVHSTPSSPGCWGQAAASWGGSSPHYMDFGLPHTQRPQFVRVQGFESDRLLCSTWVLRRERFWLLSCSVHPLHCRLLVHNTPSCHLQKFSDDSLLLLASSQMGTTESTEDLFRTLRTGACGW